MSLNLNYFIDEYVKLCSQLCKKPEDYTKEKVSMHNLAVKKLNKLKRDMHVNPQLMEHSYSILLEHENNYVQQAAATDCLMLNIHINTSVQILKKISQCGDKMSAMAAKRTLLIWEGKLNPNDPF